jgi:hypothetical protein
MSQVSNAQIQQFVDAHNDYRQQVNPPAKYMPNMNWSDDLATSASQWAAQCTWAHSQTPGVGENLYVTSERTPNINNFNPTNAVTNWGNEMANYNYDTNSCNDNKVCGHYTQMIWANTGDVGCGIQDCPIIKNLSPAAKTNPKWPDGGTLLVCQYSPPGNYIGQKPYQQV